MLKFNKRLLLIALLLTTILVVLLTGCGLGRKEITFIHQATTPATTESYWAQIIADFEAQNPSIHVNYMGLTWDQGRDKIPELVKQGHPPSVVRIQTRALPGYVAEGYVEAIDEYMTPEFKSQFVPSLIGKGAQYQGRTFGLPVAVSVRALYYNKDLFERAGITTPPQSWDDLKNAAIKVSQLSPDIRGFGIQGKGQETATYFDYFLWGNGGDVLSPDGTRAAFNNPQGVEALTFLQGLINLNITNPDPSKDERANLETDFIAGKYGMIISLNSLAAKLDTSAKFKYGVVAIPYKTKPTTFAVEDTIVLFKPADNKDLAWKFIEFMYQDQYRLDYATKFNSVPEKLTVASNPKFTVNPLSVSFAEQVKIAQFEPLNVKSQDIADTLTSELVNVYKKVKTPKAGLDAAANKVNSLLGYSATAW